MSVSLLHAPADPASAHADWIALRAGMHEACRLLLTFWRQANPVRVKADGSPVSEADESANRFLMALLARLTPEIPVVSEELPLPGPDWQPESYWLLDPLDGTRAFLRGEQEFVISLGLIHRGRPVIGLIAAPAWRESPLVAWGKVGEGAWMQSASGPPLALHARVLEASKLQREGVDLMLAWRGPTPQVDAHFAALPIRTRSSASSALKFLLLAQEKADCYPRFARLQQWDIAGGEALLTAAGGEVFGLEGSSLLYGPKARGDWQSEPFFATGRHGAAWLLRPSSLGASQGGAHA